MQVLLDERFQHERRQLRLMFTCESCVYHDEARDRCAHGYPDAPHRAAAFEPGGEGMFCKEHELV